jgi:hypothetical protein
MRPSVIALVVVMSAGAAAAADGGSATATAATDGGAATATAATDGGCQAAIGPDSAQKLFDALKEFHGADGCALEEVKTELDVMRVEWRRGGVPAPLVEVRPAACAGASVGATRAGDSAFAIAVPPATAERCPAAVEKMKAVVASNVLAAPVHTGAGSAGPPRPSSRAYLPLIVGGGGALLVVIAALVLYARRRRFPPKP